MNEPFSVSFVVLIGRENVQEMRGEFTKSVRERSIIVLMYWQSCGTHRSAVMCKELWECRPCFSPNQNYRVAEEATRLRSSADTHLFLHVGSAECLCMCLKPYGIYIRCQLYIYDNISRPS